MQELVPRYLPPRTSVPFTASGLFQNVPPRSLEIGANFSFELTGNRGAALVTKYSTYREDSVLESAFERYTKRHYKSWVAFARQKDYGNDVQPVLVSGFDMTRDFAMVSYSYEDTYIESDLTVAAPMLVSASASLWGTWRTRYTPHTNYGPQDCAPPLEQAVDISSQLTEPGIIPNAFNQCVFIRYYTMRSRGPFGLFPEVIQAGAGPHDLGPGDNTRDNFPELTVQSGAGPITSDDEDYGGQWTPTADNTSLQPDTVIRNTPYVWFSPCASVSALNFAFRIRNMTAGVQSQIMYSR